jgi:hypothetical protein
VGLRKKGWGNTTTEKCCNFAWIEGFEEKKKCEKVKMKRTIPGKNGRPHRQTGLTVGADILSCKSVCRNLRPASREKLLASLFIQQSINNVNLIPKLHEKQHRTPGY